jgi:hypothetical protein
MLAHSQDRLRFWADYRKQRGWSDLCRPVGTDELVGD